MVRLRGDGAGQSPLDGVRRRAAAGRPAGGALRRLGADPGVDPAAVITSACKDPALAVRWIDTLYWQEASLRSHDGVLGEDWRWAEEGELSVAGTQALWKLLTESVGPTDRTWGGVGPAYWSSFMGMGRPSTRTPPPRISTTSSTRRR